MTRDEEEPLLGAPRRGAEDTCMDDEGFDHGLLIAYRGGTLPEADVGRVERHLVECGYCRDMLAVLAQPVPKDMIEALADPELLRSATGSPGRSRRRWIAGAGLALAAAAAVALFSLRAPSHFEVPEYRLASVEGGARSLRSGDQTATSTVFSREAHLRIKLARLTAAGADEVQPELGVFVASRGGRLERRPVELSRGEGGDLGVEAKANALFGGELGAKTIYLVIAADPRELSVLEDRPVGALADRTGHLRWLSFDAELRGETGER